MNSDNIRRAIHSQLYVMRAQLDTILIMVEELEGQNDEGCKHPDKSRINFTTMGGPEKWQCKLCGFEYIEGKDQDERTVK